MARSYTRAELRARLERETNTQNDQHLSTDEKNDYLNVALAETWDLIISSGLHNQYVKTVSFNSVQGQLEYPIATVVPIGDFYKIHQLYVNEGNGQRRPLSRLAPTEVQAFRPPTTAVPMILQYIPSAPVWGPGDDLSTFDGINGWEEHVIMTAAMAIKMKKDDSYGQFFQRKKELEARILKGGNVDYGEPPRVQRKMYRRVDPFLMYQNNINAYGIQGGNILLWYNFGYVP